MGKFTCEAWKGGEINDKFIKSKEKKQLNMGLLTSGGIVEHAVKAGWARKVTDSGKNNEPDHKPACAYSALFCVCVVLKPWRNSKNRRVGKEI